MIGTLTITVAVIVVRLIGLPSRTDVISYKSSDVFLADRQAP